MVTIEQVISNPVTTFLLVIAGGLICSKIGMFLINKVIRKITEKTPTTLDDKLLDALQTPIQVGIVVLGVYVALKITEGVSKYGKIVDTAGYVAAVFFATWILSRSVGAFIKWYAEKMDGVDAKEGFLSKQILPFSGKLVSIAIFAVGLIIILGSLGVEIAPLIGSLGIAGLAVALALQETLSNFFAGLYFLFDKPVRVGDFVTLGEMQGITQLEGTVMEIGWRNTKIKMLNGSVVVIPNAKLAQSTFTNRSLEGREFADSVTISVSYESDLEKAKQVLQETVDRVLANNPNAVKREGIVQLAEFKDFSVNFTVIFFAKAYESRFPVKNELMFAIFKALKENEIEIPFPTRIVINK
jgi:small-conductance mechanosensitive channel